MSAPATTSLAGAAQPGPRNLPPGLQRLVRVVRVLVVMGALSLLLVPPVFWANPDWLRQEAPGAASLGAGLVTLNAQAQWLGLLGSLPGVALGLWTLWRLWRLFGEYGAGRVFGAAAQQHLAALAWGLLALAIWGPVQRMLMGLALTWGNPPGQRALVLSLGWHDYLALLTAAVLLAVATVMAEAARLAAENDGFV